MKKMIQYSLSTLYRFFWLISKHHQSRMDRIRSMHFCSTKSCLAKENQFVSEMKSKSLDNANVIHYNPRLYYDKYLFYFLHLNQKSRTYVTFDRGLILSKHLVCLNR